MSVVGTRIGRIRVESVLGRGGMGEVYVGHDETLQRQVALKSIHARYRPSSQAKARFVREAQVLSRLDHPNICKIHDFIEDEGRGYLVLELIKGRDLMAAIGNGLAPATRLPIARQIADALVAAHAEGIVHRDLKPENVMLTESGEVKVLDFGLARPGGDSDPADPAPEAPVAEPAARALEPTAQGPPGQTLPTQTGEPARTLATEPRTAAPLADRAALHTEVRTTLGAVMGTVTYMSPEQARGEVATTASDMYSFGLLLQTLFTGRGPYPPDADREEVFQRALAADTLPVTGVDGDLTKLIASLKAPAPAARPTAVAAAERLLWMADRPKRRARWLAAAAAVAILAVGGLKYTIDLRRERTIAVEAREVADQSRGQAEDLIGFMLGDLREKLEPVGRLEILDGVGEQAMEYFASVPEGDLSDEELLSRSKALYQIGEVRIAQGDLPAAEEPLRQSLNLARELSARDPSDGGRLFAVGQSHFWVGYVHWLQGDLERALAEYTSYLDASEALLEIDSDNLDWRLEVGYALTNVAAVYEKQGNLEPALVAIRRSNQIKQELAALDPTNLDRARGLANGLSWLGSILRAANRPRESLQAFRAESEVRGRILAQDPRDPASTHQVAISREFIGEMCLATGDLECALEHQRLAVKGLAAIVPLDESNTEWRQELAVSRRLLGDALLEAGRFGEAKTEYLDSRRILEELLAGDATNTQWRRHLAKAYHGLARVKLAQAEPGAPSLTRLALNSLRNLERADVRTREVLGEAYLLAGRAAKQAGRGDEAADSWSSALENLAPGSEPVQSLRTLDYRTQALFYLGRSEEARPVAEALAASGYARPGFVALCVESGLLPSRSTTP